MFNNDSNIDDEKLETLRIAFIKGERPFVDSDTAFELVEYMLACEDSLSVVRGVSDYVVDLYPANINLRIQRCIVIISQRDFIEGRGEILKLFYEAQKNPRYWIAYGWLELNENNIDAAKNHFRLAVLNSMDDKRESLDVYYEIVTNLNRQLYCDVALEYAEMAIKENPRDANLLFEKAYALEKLERNDEALSTYIECLKENAFWDIAWYNMALICSKLSNFEKANYYYLNALSLSPKDARIYWDYASNLANQGDTDEAIKVYAQYASYEKPDLISENLYIYMGSLWEDKGDVRMAKRFYTIAVKLKPKDPHVHFLLGTISIETRTYTQARKELELAIQLDPKVPHFRYALGHVMDVSGEFDKTECIKMFESGLSMQPNDALAWVEYARIIEHEYEQNHRICVDFDKLRKKFGDLPEIKLARMIALADLKLMRNREFVKELKALLKQNPQVVADAIEDELVNMMFYSNTAVRTACIKVGIDFSKPASLNDKDEEKKDDNWDDISIDDF